MSDKVKSKKRPTKEMDAFPVDKPNFKFTTTPGIPENTPILDDPQVMPPSQMDGDGNRFLLPDETIPKGPIRAIKLDALVGGGGKKITNQHPKRPTKVGKLDKSKIIFSVGVALTIIGVISLTLVLFILVRRWQRSKSRQRRDTLDKPVGSRMNFALPPVKKEAQVVITSPNPSIKTPSVMPNSPASSFDVPENPRPGTPIPSADVGGLSEAYYFTPREQVASSSLLSSPLLSSSSSGIKPQFSLSQTTMPKESVLTGSLPGSFPLSATDSLPSPRVSEHNYYSASDSISFSTHLTPPKSQIRQHSKPSWDEQDVRYTRSPDGSVRPFNFSNN